MSIGGQSTRTWPLWAVHGCMLVAAILVATSFTVGKAITPFLEPTALTLLRFLLAALLFTPYVVWRHGFSLPSPGALWRYSLISGALTGFFWLMFLSLRSTTALNTGVIFTTVPGISGIYSWILVRERLDRTRVAALLLAMVGALWVIFSGDLSRFLSFTLHTGDLLFFCGCLLMALYTPLVKLLHRGEPMAIMTLWILITGCGWLLLFLILRMPEIHWREVPYFTWVGIAYLAIFTTIITFFISQWATLRLGPTRVMAYSYLYPPLVLLIEWVLGHDLPDPMVWPGIIIILPTMILMQYQAKTSTKPPGPQTDHRPELGAS